MTLDVLTRLSAAIAARREGPPGASYTRQLLDAGPHRCARKFGEEAIETVLAAAGESREALASEAADLIYHLLVLLESRGVTLAEVLAVLEAREGVSGLAEKAQRERRGT